MRYRIVIGRKETCKSELRNLYARSKLDSGALSQKEKSLPSLLPSEVAGSPSYTNLEACSAHHRFQTSFQKMVRGDSIPTNG